jgi:hypothetical protein
MKFPHLAADRAKSRDVINVCTIDDCILQNNAQPVGNNTVLPDLVYRVGEQ